MKLLLSVLSLILLSATAEYPLLNQHVPEFSGITLDGKKIDSTFFTGKVTLLNFLSIGCQPCMKELPFLHQLDSELDKAEFQILCIAPHSREHLSDFNSNKKSPYANFRNAMNVKLINFNLMPETEISKKPDSVSETYLRVEHDGNNISKLFDVDAYPMTFIIDKTGIIREITLGYPMESSDSIYKKSMRDQISLLMNETKFNIIGKWKVIKCDFKIPGWHTDMVNSMYSFSNKNVLSITSAGLESNYINEINYSFKENKLFLKQTTYKFLEITKDIFNLENDLVSFNLERIE